MRKMWLIYVLLLGCLCLCAAWWMGQRVVRNAALNRLVNLAEQNMALAAQGKGHFAVSWPDGPERQPLKYFLQFKKEKRFWAYEERDPEPVGQVRLAFDGEKVMKILETPAGAGGTRQEASVLDPKETLRQLSPPVGLLNEPFLASDSVSKIAQTLKKEFSDWSVREDTLGNDKCMLIDVVLSRTPLRTTWRAWFTTDKGGWPIKAEAYESDHQIIKFEMSLKRYPNGAWFPQRYANASYDSATKKLGAGHVLEVDDDFVIGVDVPDSVFTWQDMGVRFPLSVTDQRGKVPVERVYGKAEDLLKDKKMQ